MPPLYLQPRRLSSFPSTAQRHRGTGDVVLHRKMISADPLGNAPPLEILDEIQQRPVSQFRIDEVQRADKPAHRRCPVAAVLICIAGAGCFPVHTARQMPELPVLHDFPVMVLEVAGDAERLVAIGHAEVDGKRRTPDVWFPAFERRRTEEAKLSVPEGRRQSRLCPIGRGGPLAGIVRSAGNPQ